MLRLIITISESYNEETNRFVHDTKEILLEHSLAAISKWESIWEKPFLSKEGKTSEESISYISCMLLHEEDEQWLSYLSEKNINEIQTYMEKRMTAIPKKKEKDTRKKRTITAESIYYMMFANNIPLECQYWHLGKLLSLIKYIQTESAPPEKLSKKEIISRNRKLNEQRRKLLNSKG